MRVPAMRLIPSERLASRGTEGPGGIAHRVLRHLSPGERALPVSNRPIDVPQRGLVGPRVGQLLVLAQIVPVEVDAVEAGIGRTELLMNMRNVQDAMKTCLGVLEVEPKNVMGLTLLGTCMVLMVSGYSVNMLTLFGMVLAIGILVDDAIVVVENIHRHIHLPGPRRSFGRLVVEAVDEVGNPTILATFAVICSILPMGFVGGLMGPYMRPIPVGASMALGLFGERTSRGRSLLGGRSANLAGEVELVAHVLDLLVLRLEPVDVTLFVGQQDLGVGDESPSQSDSLLLSTRKRSTSL